MTCKSCRAYEAQVREAWRERDEHQANALRHIRESTGLCEARTVAQEECARQVARAERAERERDAYRKAKQENDERFQLAAQRAEAEAKALRDGMRAIRRCGNCGRCPRCGAAPRIHCHADCPAAALMGWERSEG